MAKRKFWAHRFRINSISIKVPWTVRLAFMLGAVIATLVMVKKSRKCRCMPNARVVTNNKLAPKLSYRWTTVAAVT